MGLNSEHQVEWFTGMLLKIYGEEERVSRDLPPIKASFYEPLKHCCKYVTRI